MTNEERQREERLKQLEHDVREVQQAAEVVAAMAILGEVRFVESLFERRKSKVPHWPERRRQQIGG